MKIDVHLMNSGPFRMKNDVHQMALDIFLMTKNVDQMVLDAFRMTKDVNQMLLEVFRIRPDVHLMTFDTFRMTSGRVSGERFLVLKRRKMVENHSKRTSEQVGRPLSIWRAITYWRRISR